MCICLSEARLGAYRKSTTELIISGGQPDLSLHFLIQILLVGSTLAQDGTKVHHLYIKAYKVYQIKVYQLHHFESNEVRYVVAFFIRSIGHMQTFSDTLPSDAKWIGWQIKAVGIYSLQVPPFLGCWSNIKKNVDTGSVHSIKTEIHFITGWKFQQSMPFDRSFFFSPLLLVGRHSTLNLHHFEFLRTVNQFWKLWETARQRIDTFYYNCCSSCCWFVFLGMDDWDDIPQY